MVSGDIIKNAKNVEAIVNPTNKYMDYGSGVGGAIYNKAGVTEIVFDLIDEDTKKVYEQYI